MKQFAIIALSALSALIYGSCAGKSPASTVLPGGDTITTRATALTMVDYGNHIRADIADPWHKGNLLASYALVERDSAIPEGLPANTAVIRIPLERSIVYSAVHTSAIGELGALSRIAGVADGSYIPPSDPTAGMLARGEITDIGSSMAPLIETVVDLQPDAILLSPYESSSRGGIETAGVPLIEMADYMEREPLGRAEWILLLGYLYGRPDMADSLYRDVVERYEALKNSVAGLPAPKVLTERLTSGVWYVPGGQSYMARLLADAGAEYPWADTDQTGSIPLDEAAVIDRAADADYWLIKDARDINRAVVRNEVPHAGAFAAYPNGIYVCNTMATDFFNDLAFHPERILADYISILHPGVGPDSVKRYFRPIE